MIPKEIEIGKVYRIFGTSLYLGQVKKFDGETARMLMVTGRIISVPWYEINTIPSGLTKEKLKKKADTIYKEEDLYLKTKHGIA